MQKKTLLACLYLLFLTGFVHSAPDGMHRLALLRSAVEVAASSGEPGFEDFLRSASHKAGFQLSLSSETREQSEARIKEERYFELKQKIRRATILIPVSVNNALLGGHEGYLKPGGSFEGSFFKVFSLLFRISVDEIKETYSSYYDCDAKRVNHVSAIILRKVEYNKLKAQYARLVRLIELTDARKYSFARCYAVSALIKLRKIIPEKMLLGLKTKYFSEIAKNIYDGLEEDERILQDTLHFFLDGPAFV